MTMDALNADDSHGRVVLQLGSGNPDPVALEAALRIARALQSEVESLFIEDIDVLEIANLPFSREISFSGRRTRDLTTRDLERDMRLTAAALRRQMQRLASRAGVTARFAVVRDEPVSAVAAACASGGPGQVVALGECLRPGNAARLHRLFEAVSGKAGLVFTGPQARRSNGPVVVVAEDIEHLPAMMSMAGRLSGRSGDMILLMIGEDEAALEELEGQIRLALGGDLARVALTIAQVTLGEPKVIAEALRRLRGGFVIGSYGGLLVPSQGDMKDLIRALECPLLLMP